MENKPVTIRRELITAAAYEIAEYFKEKYNIDDDTIPADVMGMIDSNIGYVLSSVKYIETPTDG